MGFNTRHSTAACNAVLFGSLKAERSARDAPIPSITFVLVERFIPSGLTFQRTGRSVPARRGGHVSRSLMQLTFCSSAVCQPPAKDTQTAAILVEAGSAPPSSVSRSFLLLQGRARPDALHASQGRGGGQGGCLQAPEERHKERDSDGWH